MCFSSLGFMFIWISAYHLDHFTDCQFPHMFRMPNFAWSHRDYIFFFMFIDIIFSTVHKAKGLEFNTVRLTDDFNVGQEIMFGNMVASMYYHIHVCQNLIL